LRCSAVVGNQAYVPFTVTGPSRATTYLPMQKFVLAGKHLDLLNFS
jgi:hypothetical protein